MPEDLSSNLQEQLDRLSRAVSTEPDHILKFEGRERREVTILFLDIVGFTQITEKLKDPERVFHVLDSMFRAFEDIIEKHNGNIEKYIGDAIMAVWGSEQAHEDDSVHAIAAALEIIETLPLINDAIKTMDVNLNVRIGINTGPVVFGKREKPKTKWVVIGDSKRDIDWVIIGDAVNIAARLESKAAPGSILVGSSVRERAGDAYKYLDKGIITVKGKAIPIHVFSIEGKGPGRKDPWERVELVQKSPIVGRNKELDYLNETLEADTVLNLRGSVRHRLIGITAEAGLGKSRLCREFVRDVNIRHLKGKTKSGVQIPYHLWISLLRDYFDISEGDQDARSKFDDGIQRVINELSDEHDSETVVNNLSKNKSFLGKLLSIQYVDERFDILDAASMKLEIMLALRFLLEAICFNNRLILLLDDFQWIDDSSSETLKYILENSDTREPILFLCSYRPEGKLPEGHSNYVQIEELKLNSLSDNDCRDLSKYMLDDISLPEEVESFILERANGNPLYLEEVLLSLVQKGAIHREKDSWKLAYPLTEAEVPPNLNAVILGRVDGLSPVLKDVLKRASVIGSEFLYRTYSRLIEKLGISEESSELLTTLEKRGFLEGIDTSNDRKFKFVHRLTRDVIYNTLLIHDRKMLHKLTAETIEEIFSDDLEDRTGAIARHWELAEDRERSIEWSAKCLEICVRKDYIREGLNWTSKLVEWLEASPESKARDFQLMDILEAQRKFQVFSGLLDDFRLTLDRLSGLYEKWSLTKQKNELLISYGRLYRLLGKSEEALNCFIQALESTKDIDDYPLQYDVLINLGMLFFRSGNFERALKYYLEAIEINSKYEYLQNKGSLLSNLGLLYYAQGNSEEALDYYHQALEIHRQNANQHNESIVLSNLGEMARDQEKYKEAEDYYNKSLAIHTKVGNRQNEGRTLVKLGEIHDLRGNVEESLIFYKKALNLCDEVQNPGFLGYITLKLGNWYQTQKLFETALEYYQKSLSAFREVNDHIQEAGTLTHLGILYFDMGDSEKSLDCYRKTLLALQSTSLDPEKNDDFIALRQRLIECGLTIE